MSNSFASNMYLDFLFRIYSNIIITINIFDHQDSSNRTCLADRQAKN